MTEATRFLEGEISFKVALKILIEHYELQFPFFDQTVKSGKGV